ncbi:hypothetical protein TIFTF001_008371 [Ficus carica]|uniref:Uncharacterized protein n=1 Tax=Ficus carica TaxID=3494 RepID=A0AA88AEY6_FICCA|nr:hypothetical protein TIFTF001_008371 [Ficus carica]
MEAPRNDGDTGVVSAVGTPMLKSARILMQGERQSFGKAKMTIPGSRPAGATSPMDGCHVALGVVQRAAGRNGRHRQGGNSACTGARLLSAVKEEGWSERPIPDLVLLPGSRCSEHYTV